MVQTSMLVTTNILARGIDVPNVSMVIQYDLPLKMVCLSGTNNAIFYVDCAGWFAGGRKDHGPH
jgi:superfamily II DNA/RNA helicase